MDMMKCTSCFEWVAYRDEDTACPACRAKQAQAQRERALARYHRRKEEDPHLVAYEAHRNTAKTRGIGFHFTYEEWLDWWGEDIERRGPAPDQLCMARHQDQGDYHPDNVTKATNLQNSRREV